MRELSIDAREAGQRFDKFLKKYLAEAPPSFLYRMLRKKNITLNGGRAEGKTILSEGDVVRLFLSEETIESFRGTPAAGEDEARARARREAASRLAFAYEDDDTVIVDKPAGLLTQPAEAGGLSLADLLPEALLMRGSLREADLRAFRPAPLNRLDRNTSGLVMCGKSVRGAQLLSDLIRRGALKKEYLAIAHGARVEDGSYSAYALRDTERKITRVTHEAAPGAKPMTTVFQTLGADRGFSLIRAGLVTGRTHQIRAHLASLHAPVVGDEKYGPASEAKEMRRLYGARRQLLHAERLLFPRGGDMPPGLSGAEVVSPLPEDFRSFIEAAGLTTAFSEAFKIGQ